jgi:RNA polymerase sigma factor (sigma-70 family)
MQGTLTRQELLAKLTDEQLLTALRAGDKLAYGELWRRHSRAGLKAARSYQHLGEPEDLVAEAFARIYKAIMSDKGPAETFRPYLYVTIRNIALSNIRALSQVSDGVELSEIADTRFDEASLDRRLDASLTIRAFRSLTPRWQEVLWYLDVEGMSGADTGELMGLNANAVSALAFRAREGLRSAWLQAHINEAAIDGEHKDALSKVGEYARGTLSPRETRQLEKHLQNCAECSLVVREVNHVARRLALVLLPLLMGSTAAATFLEPSSRASAESIRPPLHHVTKGVGTIAVAVGVGIALLGASVSTVVYGIQHESPASSTSSTQADELSNSTQRIASGSPTSPGGTAADAPSNEPPSGTGDSRTPSTKKSKQLSTLAVPTFSPGLAGMLTNNPSVHLSGTGSPGAEIYSQDQPVATVGSDGDWAWSTPPLPDGVDTVSVTERADGWLASAAATVQLTVDTIAPAAPVVNNTIVSSLQRPQLNGVADPGARVSVLSSSGTAIATTVADGAGNWATGALASLSPLETSLSVVQTDSAGNVSAPATVGPFELYPQFTPVGSGGIPVAQDVLPDVLQGWPGASVTIRLDGVDVATYVLDGNGLVPGLSVGSPSNPLPPGAHNLVAVYSQNGIAAAHQSFVIFYLS